MGNTTSLKAVLLDPGASRRLGRRIEPDRFSARPEGSLRPLQERGRSDRSGEGRTGRLRSSAGKAAQGAKSSKRLRRWCLARTFVYELDDQSPLRVARAPARAYSELRFKGRQFLAVRRRAAITASRLAHHYHLRRQVGAAARRRPSRSKRRPRDSVRRAPPLKASNTGPRRRCLRARQAYVSDPPTSRSSISKAEESRRRFATIPRHAPSEGDPLIAFEPNTARYQTRCAVQAAISEDLSRFGYGCSPRGHGPYEMEPRSRRDPLRRQGSFARRVHGGAFRGRRAALRIGTCVADHVGRGVGCWSATPSG